MKRFLKFIVRIIKIIVKLYTGYYILKIIFLLLLKNSRSRKFIQYPIVYTKEFPFHLDRKAVHRIRFLAQFLFTVLSTALIGFIILDNLAPFGITVEYKSGDINNISPIGPKNRVNSVVINGEQATKVEDNLTYFTTNIPFQFDTAKVKVVFQNSDPEQNMSIGFQDQEKWHYDTKLFDAPLLNSLSWNRIGNNPTLYQKTPTYQNIDNFLQNPPIDALIGTYEYDVESYKISYTTLPNYTPSNSDTVIDTPLRGKQIIYAYLENEPFHMTIQKQDLNWYDDPDTMTVQVYKGKDLVYQTTADDDGISDSSRKVLPPQEIDISNPGKQNAEKGVYKIIISASADTVVKKITTNLHKIVFQGTLFPIANAGSYPKITTDTIPTTVYSNALVLFATAVHPEGKQQLLVGDTVVPLNAVNLKYTITPPQDITQVVIPKSDITLTGFQGYFAFSQDQFFLPTQYHIFPISKADDLSLVDYVLTDYTPSKQVGEYRVAERTFDIRSAVTKKGKLDWLIQTPGLKDNNRTLTIKSIDIIFSKKPWL